jgi:predicted SnoaL-like aldol condensation-catalyzing enzyme
VESMEMFRLADGKIAELWVVMDLLGFFQQLGVVPDVP